MTCSDEFAVMSRRSRTSASGWLVARPWPSSARAARARARLRACWSGSRRPTAGRITFDGIEVVTATGEESRTLHQRIQIVFQDPYCVARSALRCRAARGRRLVPQPGGPCGQTEARQSSCSSRWACPVPSSTISRTSCRAGSVSASGIARALAADPDLLICRRARQRAGRLHPGPGSQRPSSASGRSNACHGVHHA